MLIPNKIEWYFWYLTVIKKIKEHNILVKQMLIGIIYSINNTIGAESKRFNQRELVAMSACMNVSVNKKWREI